MKWDKIFLISTVFSLILILTIGSCTNSTEIEERNWSLVWQDEFNGESGILPDSTKWGFDVGTGWGNRQLEYDTDRSENASMDGDGHLVIKAIKESYMGQNYTSARITTKGLFESDYGKYTARIYMPWGQGIWPAFWLLGADIDTNPWPQCGEIDIMEYRGQEPQRIHGTVHGPGYSGIASISEKFELVNDRFDTGFHIFTIEWGKNYIEFYVDNQLYKTITPDDVTGEWVYDHPFYIILNLAVGGDYVGWPDESTVFPQSMIVDYVRVYK